MSIFPFLEAEQEENKAAHKPYKEYEIDLNTNKLTGKVVQDKSALIIWIYKVLKTPRYIYPIYTWDYGQDLDELIGKGYEEDYIKSEVERKISECLTINKHIIRCHNFTISIKNDTLQITFTVDTTFGQEVINV